MHFTLRHRVLAILAGFVAVTFFLGLVVVWYTFRMEGLMASITERDLRAFRNAEALETALMRQKGLTSYYLLDNNPQWLEDQAAQAREFLDRLDRVRQDTNDPSEQHALDEWAAAFDRYTAQKRKAIALYRAGETASGAAVHAEAHRMFDVLLQRSHQFKQFHTDRILLAEADSHAQTQRLRITAMAAIFSSTVLTLLLAFVFVYQILAPLRRLMQEAYRSGSPAGAGDEVKALSQRVRVLLHNVDSTQSELERSREVLIHSEKMALVGKLAASMAHSIRNPFTSVKMRLFSLSRSLELDDVQKEDFEVISAEIRHIDTIVQNFLEFSRPPPLKIHPVSPSTAVDSALRLLEHRLKAYDVTVGVVRPASLPEVPLDLEQLKEVIVNLVVNACEAMPHGGLITITEELRPHPLGGMVAVIQVADTGPGIPAHLKDRVFQPFFSTKEQGTGLGLSIAQRIIADHHGRLEVESIEGRGAVFIIALPLKEPEDERHSDH